MKYLGVDFGTKKVGIALSDEAGEFAFPNAIVPNDNAVSYISALCKKEEVQEIVIGESRASNDIPNNLHETVQAFAKNLKQVTELPISFEREGFSSMEAHRYQIKKGDRDDSAAAVILQRFLDKRKK